MKLKFIHILICSISMLYFSSCNSDSSDKSQKEENNDKKEIKDRKEKEEKENDEVTYKIKDDDNDLYAEISISDQSIKITNDKKKYKSELKKDKRKYFEKSGNTLYLVQLGDENKIKLCDEGGKLLYNIKIYKDKIKVSDNEEGNNPSQIKIYEDKVKIKDDQEAEIGSVKLDKDKTKIIVKSKSKSYTINNKELFGAYGVLAIPQIPKMEKLIILAELLMLEK